MIKTNSTSITLVRIVVILLISTFFSSCTLIYGVAQEVRFSKLTKECRLAGHKPRSVMAMNCFRNKEKTTGQQNQILPNNLRILKEVNLNNTKNNLNDIELSLLNRYANVLVTGHYCYFIKNELGYIGLASICGDELIAPVNNNVRFFSNGYLLFGESTNDFDDVHKVLDVSEKNTFFDVGLSLGSCKGVVKFEKGWPVVIIQEDRYDQIKTIPAARGLQIHGFIVCKIDSINNDSLWGACDKYGKEILECKYKSVYYNGLTFKGDEHNTMDYWQKYYVNKIEQTKQEKDEKKRLLATTLNSFGNSIIQMAKTTEPSNQNTTIPNHPGSQKKSNKTSQYQKDTSEKLGRDAEYKAYENYADLLMKMKYGIIEYNSSKRKEYQSIMKKIRTKWEKNGYQFTKLEWEDWDGN